MDEHKKIYLEESEDLLNTMEQSLLSLEYSPDDEGLIDEIFRSMHTIKGTSGMFGFQNIADFVHNLETLYSEVRDGKIKVDKKIIECTFSCLDHIKKIIHDSDLKEKENTENHQSLTDTLLSFLGDRKVAIEQPVAQEPQVTSLQTYHIFFEPSLHVFKDGTNPLYLIEDLSALGKAKIYPHIKSPKSFKTLDATNCYTSWDVLLVSKQDKNAILDIFVFVESDSTVAVNVLHDGDALQYSGFTKAIEPDGLHSSPFSLEQLKNDLAPFILKQPNMDKTVVSTNADATNQVAESTNESVRGKEKAISSIRVSSDKLDELMNQVSELVTTQAGLSLYSENNYDPTLEVIAENVEKLSRQLRDIAFGMTLIQIETLFGRFQRVVRDLSNQLGKSVAFVTEGGETELDKTIIESLTDPLMHLLRNSLDHGIESGEERIAKGKPEQGTIKLTSFYSAAKVYIKIEDDGKGLDLERIQAKAIDKKLISKDDELTDKEIMELIFAPGFSTSQNVTELSGRGVGMDVVRRNLLDIRGDISIDSQKDKGTQITLGLPLTLSIIDGLLVKVQATFFVIPLSLVDKCYEVKREELKNDFNQLLVLDNEQTPFVDLRSEFLMLQGGKQSDEPELASVILVKNEDKKIGICVDSIVGEYQAVLKPVGKYYRDQEFVSGATILGDGTIALVLDTYKIIEQKSKMKTLAT